MSTFTHICVAGTNVPVLSGTFVPVRSGTFVPVCKKRPFIPDKTKILCLMLYIFVAQSK